MILYLSNQTPLIEDSRYRLTTVEEVLDLFKDIKLVQFDTETDGLNPHLKQLMTLQIGSDKIDTRVVIDCTTVDIHLFKEFLESKMLVCHNGKFDLQFLYKQGIVPRKIYDTMIAEQLLYLGYRPGYISYSLKACAERYLGIDIDKTVRGQIRWRGIDAEVIVYGAGDVTYLEQIMWKQYAEAKRQNCLKGVQIECEAVPAIAYLEYCGICLDAKKWEEKIIKNKKLVVEYKEQLNNFVVSLNEGNNPFCYLDPQGDLFSGFSDKPSCIIDWNSPAQVTALAKYLGFDTSTQDKKTGKDKDSVMEKALKPQKGINDEFLKLYFAYKEAAKEVSSFGYGHINAVNPLTNCIHTTWRQIGTASGRMSCGEGTHPDEELAQYKHLPKGACPKVNLQQLPADEETRSCFISPPGHLMVSADFSAEESRLAAEIYNEPVLLEEFLHGSGDVHSVFAKTFFAKELEGVPVKDIKEKYPEWRKLAKGPEFALSFGGGTGPIKSIVQCSEERAQEIYNNYQKNMKATCDFARKGALFVKSHGYIIIDPYSGNRMHWADWKDWYKEEQLMKYGGYNSFSKEQQNEHRKTGAYWERMARNAVTQGSGAVILKIALKNLFDYIIDNNYFNKIKIVAAVHDEIVCTFPEENKDFPKILEQTMENAAAVLVHKLPIPAEASVGNHWIH